MGLLRKKLLKEFIIDNPHSPYYGFKVRVVSVDGDVLTVEPAEETGLNFATAELKREDLRENNN